jgi:hypothetical protein
MARKVGMDTRDLRAVQAAINTFRTVLPEAGTKVLEEAAKDNSRKAASAVMSRPGASGKYKREPEAYDWERSRGGHPAVAIERGGTAIGAEFGANFHTVFGRRVSAKSMKRRVFGARVKRTLSGKVVGRVTKQALPGMERDLAIAFDHTAEREFTKRGL